MIKLSPSILACDFSELKNEIIKVERAGADYLHIDVMDGHFVPNISFGVPIIESIRKHSNLVFDVHLMISDPKKYAESFASAGADIITFHYEAYQNPKEIIDYIHSLGKKAGISIKPNTDANVLVPFINDVELILIMTVEPGFGGQSLIPKTLESISKVYEMVKSIGKQIDIEVDGGINPENAPELVKRGANVIVAGSSVFKSENTEKAVASFKLL